MMSSTNEGDPFLQVQQDVLTQLNSARPLFASYLRIRSLTTAANSPELASARSDLEYALATLAEDLADLVESVKAVESDPVAFGLDRAEVTRRKRLVQEVGGEVEDMRDELAKRLGDAAAAIAHGKKKQAAGDGSSSSDLPDPNAFAIPDGEGGSGAGGDSYAEFEHHQQLHMLRDQEEDLEGVFQTVGNLRRQADDMGRELEEQREMLEVVDGLADRVGDRLQTGMQKMQYIIKRNEDRWSSFCIAVLIFVLILLLILLLVL
ncbi:hypothetical protein RB598_002413 [Gaeumannomyces tritici]